MSAHQDSPATVNGSAPGGNSRRLRLPRSRRSGNPEARMPLIEHLRELRNRVFKALLVVTCASVAGWYLYPAVWKFIEAPYCRLPNKLTGGAVPHGSSCQLYVTGLFDSLFLRLKLAIAIGIIISAPFWLYQLWAFIAPGLHRHERRWAYAFVGVAAPLFAAGAVLAYFVVAKGLGFLLQFTPSNVTTFLEVTGYVKFITNFMLLFGVAFEFPLIIVLFNLAGIASYKRLLGWWRTAVFILFAFAAITVPTPDPFGMSAMGACLVSLYFGAVLFAYINDKRRERRHRAEYGNLDDDEISELDYDLDPVEAGTPAEHVEPVAPPRALDRRYDDMT
jgi:sec-independent protein translocase protein TatC